MKNRKCIPFLLSLIAGFSVLFATTVSRACWPFDWYQPKAPKSLIKED